MVDLVRIKTYQNRMEAELAKGLLESKGVKAMVSADDAGGAHPALLWATGGVRLLVKKKDIQKAIKVLESFKE
ncbi:DUF2007 domain-containing protein [Patescibacteria group bacterium]|nr:DUF2007 domain-containing protein [Patescibacteria group bacterium]